jgi:hypothetical protein
MVNLLFSLIILLILYIIVKEILNYKERKRWSEQLFSKTMAEYQLLQIKEEPHSTPPLTPEEEYYYEKEMKETK